MYACITDSQYTEASMAVGEQNGLGGGGEAERICPKVQNKIFLKKGLHFQVCPNIFKFARITSK